MPDLTQSRAMLMISQREHTAFELKRLALLFDEIIYLPPRVSILSQSLRDDRSRIKHMDKTHCYIEDFSWVRDCPPGISTPDEQLRGPGLSEVVCEFRKAGIMRPCQFAPGVWKPLPDLLLDVMDQQCNVDIRDSKFVKNAGTDPNEFNKPINMGGMTLSSDNGEKIEIIWVNPPHAVNISQTLSMLSFYANEESASPIMLDSMYQKAMNLRISRLPKEIQKLQVENFKVSDLSSYQNDFGAAAFRLSGVLFDEKLIEELSTDDIVQIRNSLKEPRQDFISTHLLAVTELVESDPWSEHLVDKVDKYVRTQLAPALRTYNQEGRILWEGVVGKGMVRFAEVIASGTTGGGIGGLAASILPNTNFWGLLLLGAAAGALKTSPKIVGDLVDLSAELRERKRNGLSYMKNILKVK